jgi:hypothetical protein
MNKKELEDLEGDLIVIEKEILPDLRESLSQLTGPDYDPAQNPDDELRDQDIAFLMSEIAENEKAAASIRAKLGLSQ